MSDSSWDPMGLTPGLSALGADARLFEEFRACTASLPEPNGAFALGRVGSAVREIYHLLTATGEVVARPAGRLRTLGELPLVGDWVVFAVDPADPSSARVLAVLPRRTLLSRKGAGTEVREQGVAANVDVVLLVMGLDRDFNLNRLERFSVMAWESGAEPVVVLTKADLLADENAVAEACAEVEARLPGLSVVALSALRCSGLAALAPWLRPGRTLALLGSSGAGKSTLANALLGEERLLTGAVRDADGRGRHTTTRRELLTLPGGALLLDNPGVREIQLWAETDQGLEDAFDDIATLAAGCRFGDCRHQGEPGCAVQAAVRSGKLPAARLESYFKLERELSSLELRQDVVARRQAERAFGKMARQSQSVKKERRGG